ncbi:hypothetical protein BU14_0245s0010 [Porphyra umbilicalis]|uniref:Mediator of RNA polymerase II transcription subunit 4 n=1 Tax=Porphyra umbilicalis TaxID=2786 RepID=A0A1X6P309_PORUM|nr:hypothetical protein BU14_0245s0010 [Porphyra umbilicalis]|eukprot:OSX75228.1 hypothetical protein BU14_0245s0010 [Porphyra umbilicalis]
MATRPAARPPPAGHAAAGLRVAGRPGGSRGGGGGGGSSVGPAGVGIPGGAPTGGPRSLIHKAAPGGRPPRDGRATAGAAVATGVAGGGGGIAGAARDFDASVPVRDRARTVLRECRSLVARLFEAVDALVGGRMSSEAVMQPEQVMEALLDRQRVLRALLDELTEHQRTAATIARLTATLSSTAAALSALHASLSDAEASLQGALDAARPRLVAAAASAARPLPVPALIAAGARLAPAIAAPPGWAPPQPLGGSVPPAVTDEAMWGGRLAALAGGGPRPRPGGRQTGASPPPPLSARGGGGGRAGRRRPASRRQQRERRGGGGRGGGDPVSAPRAGGARAAHGRGGGAASGVACAAAPWRAAAWGGRAATLRQPRPRGTPSPCAFTAGCTVWTSGAGAPLGIASWRRALRDARLWVCGHSAAGAPPCRARQRRGAPWVDWSLAAGVLAVRAGTSGAGRPPTFGLGVGFSPRPRRPFFFFFFFCRDGAAGAMVSAHVAVGGGRRPRPVGAVGVHPWAGVCGRVAHGCVLPVPQTGAVAAAGCGLPPHQPACRCCVRLRGAGVSTAVRATGRCLCLDECFLEPSARTQP